MRFHDYRLDSYEVSDAGRTITFHLLFDYPNLTKDESIIRFTNVTLYNLTHTTEAIFTDIEECSLPDLLAEIGSRVIEWGRQLGVGRLSNDLEAYQNELQSDGYKAWRINSAIGFYGFVIAKNVRQVDA
jgi:hypothetical protein